jgi:predicted DNA-binding transcriptional regulator AlpA
LVAKIVGKIQPPRTHHLDNRAAELIAAGAGDPDDLMTISEVAAWFRVSLIWLHIARMHGYGPPFVKIAPRHIRYKRSDVLSWLKSRTFRVTSEYEQRSRSRAGRKKKRIAEARIDAT